MNYPDPHRRRDRDAIRTDPQPIPPRPHAGYVDPMKLFQGDVDHDRIDRIVRDMYR